MYLTKIRNISISVVLIVFFIFPLQLLSDDNNIVNNADDLCYDSPSTEGLFCIDMGVCSGGVGCKTTYPLSNKSDSTLLNVVVDYNETNMGGSFGSSCGVDPSGTCKTVNNIDFGPFGMLGQATEFNITDPISPEHNNTNIWTKNTINMSCFDANNLYATYIKDGILHRGKVKACNAFNNISHDYDKEDDFKQIYSKITNGDIAATGAPIMCAKANANQCDWNYKGYLFDIDPLTLHDGSSSVFTKNSAGAILKLPSNVKGSDILWARLYWQGHIFGLGNHNDFLNAIDDIKNVKMVDPNGDIHQLSSNSSNLYYYGYDEKPVYNSYKKGYRLFYQASADVTSIVKQSYDNTHNYFVVGNISATMTKDIYYIKDTKLDSYVKWGNWGGWALIVAYKDPNASMKNISLYDGFKFLLPPFGSTASLTIDLPPNSFYTPQYGTVKSKTIMFAAGAEKKIAADKLEIKNKNQGYLLVSNTLNPPDNQINDSITYLGEEINPIRIFNTGIDLDTYDTSNILANGQTTTSIRVTMKADTDKSDQAFIGFIGISNDIYQPKICYNEQLFDSNQTEINASSHINVGDTINVQLTIKNDDNETANNVKISRNFENNETIYKSNSTIVNNINSNGTLMGDTNQTDVVGDDLTDFDQNNKTLKIRIGRGANSINGGNFLPNDTVYVKYKTKINTDKTIDLSYDTSYTFTIAGQQFNFNGPLPKCTSFDNTIHAYLPHIGTFNVTNGYANLNNTDPLNGKDIKNSLLTQVANQNFPIKVLHLNGSDKTTLEDYTGLVFLDVVDASAITNNPTTCSNAPLVYEIPADNTPIFINESIKNISVKIPKAAKNVTFRVGFTDWAKRINNRGLECANRSTTSGVLKGIPACLDTQNKIAQLFPDKDISVCLTSGPHGANAACNPNNYNTNGGSKGNIQPYRYNHRYGCARCLVDQYVCARDNFSIRPAAYTIDIGGGSSNLIGGKIYSLDINATDTISTEAVSGYTQNIDNSSDKNGTTKLIVPTGCSLSTSTQLFNSTINFTNGAIDQPAYFSYNNIGDVNITLSDNEWTKVDQKLHNGKTYDDCIKASASNTPDSNGKVGCIVKGSKLYKFIPKTFKSTLLISNFLSHSFTYISNDNNMSARIDLKFTAILDDNTPSTINDNPTATNYTKNCFAKDINYTIRLINNKNLSWGDTINRIKFYNDKNLSISQKVSSGTGYADFNSSKDNFTNGVANIKIHFNFDRNSSIADEPFRIFKNDFNITQVVDSTGVNGSDFDRTNDQNATFYYGKVTVPDYESGSSLIKNVKIYYEIYCKNCNKSLFLDIGEEDPNGIYWYINKSHNSPIDGNISGFPYSYTSTPTAKLLISPAIQTITNGVEEHTIKYTFGIFPYKERIDLNVSKWLYYDRYNSGLPISFTVTFQGGSGWAGIGQTGKIVDLNISTKSSKRIEW